MMRVLIKKVRTSTSATASLLSTRGAIVPADRPLSVKFPARYADSFEAGSVWDVSGKTYERSYRISNRTITEDFVEIRHAVRVCPEGPWVAYWIEKNVHGIGKTTAQKLTRAIKNLNQTILEGNLDALCAIDGMNATKAQELIARWPDEMIYSAMRFLADCGLPAKLAEPITQIYKTRTEELIKSDPYLLVPLGVPFDDVELLIKQLRLTVKEDDRNVAIAEDAAHRITATGSTVVLRSEIEKLAKNMGYSISKTAPDEAVQRGVLIQVEGGYQTTGMAQMEAIVGHRITNFACRAAGEKSLSATWERDITETSVNTKLSEFESEQLGFELTDDQRQAVIGSMLSPVACISGGAGVGKTTILRAILGVYKGFNAPGMKIHMMALSGRAAQRISHSTGYPAKTIAKHTYDNIRSPEYQATSKEEHALVVIDEASMVDLHSMYRLASTLPDATRLLFVGDTGQLPPVGPGLIFHELVKSGIPTFNLTTIQRQAADSGIHKFATSVIAGQKPLLSKLGDCLKDSPDFCHSNALDLERITSLWDEAGRSEQCIILAPRRSGKYGVDSVNAYIQNFIGNDRPVLLYLDDSHGLIPWRINGRHLYLGDQVLVTKNDYRYNIWNGDLATITEVYSQPMESGEYGVMKLEGKSIPINDEVIEKLDLGFCITIHKSQGSEWPVAVMLLSPEGENMTDRSLLYTGATRAQERLVILGREASITRAIERGNFSDIRKVAIRELLPKPRPTAIAC
ncbi:AAA family ATPase [Marinobacter sp. 1Y8]|tara:strand:+ start:6072 stop:8300 length:2229 start_codon:yes stop_codon:yes gene_type:complete